MTPTRFAVAVIILVLAGCTGLRIQKSMLQRPYDWTMYGGGPSRSNVAATRIRPPFRMVWQYNAQAGLSGTPLVRDSIVVVGTLHGELQAVNLTNGRRLGYKVLEAPIVGTPVLDGLRAIVAVSSAQKSVLSIDLSNGQQGWEFEAGPVESSPLGFGDHLYVTTLKGSAVCLGKAGGDLVWKWEAGDGQPIRSSPATDGTVLCFGSDNGVVYGLDRVGGTVKWTRNTGSSVFASPVISNGLAVVGNLGGTVLALDAETGAVRWTYETGSKVYGGASGTRDAMFVGSADGILHALNAANGGLLWKFRTGSVISSAPLLSGNLVIVGSLDHHLYVLDAGSGRELWKVKADGRIRISPVAWGEYLLVTSEDKYVTAFIPQEPT